MKLPPASEYTSKIRLASALEAPQPSDASSPNVIAPRQTSDTRSPLGPRSLNFMGIGLPLRPPSVFRGHRLRGGDRFEHDHRNGSTGNPTRVADQRQLVVEALPEPLGLRALSLTRSHLVALALQLN